MSQYIGLNEMGELLRRLYEKYLENPKRPGLEFNNLASFQLSKEFQIIQNMKNLGLLEINETQTEIKPVSIYLTNTGISHASQIMKYLNNIPELK